MKNVIFVLMASLVIGFCGCASEKFGSTTSGVGVVFDGAPLISDPSVGYMGTTVGQIVSSQWSNGVTRLTVSFNNDSQNLVAANMALVVKNGRLDLVPLSRFGQPLADQASMLGFNNRISLQWFKLKNIINDINMAAARQAKWLSSLSGLSG